ncbi:MAG: acyl-CoA dehydrogenase family protein [Gammaproteobacteria bacterium]
MDFDPDPRDEAFRLEVRAWLRANLPPNLIARARFGEHGCREDQLMVARILNRRGWSAPAWPVAHGGQGWSAMQRQILHEELYATGAPALDVIALNLVGPVLCEFGSPAQQARFLPKILNGEEAWCQGFSEPGSGSDLASLRTRAVRDGDAYVVNGQKIWTSQGHYADWMYCLVRTDPAAKPHKGISALLIDMRSPGITLRPIHTLDGGHTLNQTFLDEVRVPLDCLVGEEGRGWDYTRFLLVHERTLNAQIGLIKHDLRNLKAIAAAQHQGGVALADDALFRTRLAEIEIELLALEYSVLRLLTMPENDPGLLSVAGILKVRGSELLQRIALLATEAIGVHAIVQYPSSPELAADGEALPGPAHALGLTARALFRRAASIYGGTNEIQRNIIARSILDL